MSEVLRAGTPQEAGLDPARVEHIKELCVAWVEDGTHPALAVLVARHGVVALHEAYGRLGPEPDAPELELDSIFPLASLSKPFTATAVMALVEDGLVGLTRPVKDYLPLFVRGDDICVHHLLTHTSGDSDDDNVAYILGNWNADDIPPPDDDRDPIVHKQLALGGRAPLRCKPGESMNYTNGNYITLGEIVRSVAGCSIDVFARERIFAPLGMKDTDYFSADNPSKRAVRRAPEWLTATDLAIFQAVSMPAAGVHSTTMDLAVFGQTFLNGGTDGGTRILSEPTVAEMTRNQIPGVGATLGNIQVDEASWGFGWGVSCTQKWPGFPIFPEGTFHHGGGSGTFLWADRANDVVGVFLSVARPVPVEGFLIPELDWTVDLFANAVYSAVE